MPSIRHIAHKMLPQSLIRFVQRIKKKKRNIELQKQAQNGGLNHASLVDSLKKTGVISGDVLLVHSALSKLGFVDGGAKTVVESLLEVVGESGHLLMPTSPNNGRQLDFIKQNPVFDVKNTPSRMGAISEYFRKLPNTKRSLHPTESVACIGPNSDDFIQGHFQALTPYRMQSPFGKVITNRGKILMIGVTLDNAGTNVHCLEDAVDFPFPVYVEQIFEAMVIDEQGNQHTVKTKVHNPEMSSKRYCDYLIPILEKEGILTKHKIGDASCLLIDAQGMFDCLKKELNQGMTIYGRVS